MLIFAADEEETGNTLQLSGSQFGPDTILTYLAITGGKETFFRP